MPASPAWPRNASIPPLCAITCGCQPCESPICGSGRAPNFSLGHPRWWEFNDDHRWLAVSLIFGLMNLAYVLLGAAGLVRSREFFGIGLFVLFLALRSGFLGTLENPEPRYTLECYPAVIILASALFHRPE